MILVDVISPTVVDQSVPIIPILYSDDNTLLEFPLLIELRWMNEDGGIESSHALVAISISLLQFYWISADVIFQRRLLLP